MNRIHLLAVALSLALASPALADTYAAISNTATSITGDIEFDDFGITFENGEQITFDELIGDSFMVDGQRVNASVYSIAEPKDPVLLNGNRLCGAPVTYIASWGTSDNTATVVAVFSTKTRRKAATRCVPPMPTNNGKPGLGPALCHQQATCSISIGRRSMRAKAARI